MLNKREYQIVLIEGTLVGDAVINDGGEIPSVSFMLMTVDKLLDEHITQIHNIIAIGDDMLATIEASQPGQRIRVRCKIIWHDSDYADSYIEGERSADLIADHLLLLASDDTSFVGYQSIMLAGCAVENADYKASMEGSSTRFCITTKDTFIGESLLQFHSFMALNKTALACKDIKAGEFVRVIGQLLWLDGKSTGAEYNDERSLEIVVSKVTVITLPAELDIKPASQIHDNITDLIQLIDKTGNIEEAVKQKSQQHRKQRLLNKIFSTPTQ